MHRFPIFLIVSALAFAGVPILGQQQASPTTPAPTAIPKPATEAVLVRNTG